MNTDRRAVLTLPAGIAGMAVASSATRGQGLPAPLGPTSSPAWTYVPPGESVQATFQRGARAVALGAGSYALSSPLVIPRGAQLVGIGQGTRLRAAGKLAAVIQIGRGGPADGVRIADLSIECERKASVGIDLHIVGEQGNYQREPDAVCRLDNLLIYDASTDGLAYRGPDTQGVVTTRVRVRRAGRHGFNISAPDNWFDLCEATTSDAGGAGFLLASSNTMITSCKAWYCRGYGFQVTNVRNQLVGCSAQDIRLNGYQVDVGQAVLSACIADTCSAKSVRGTSGGADGFYVRYDDQVSLVGCQAFDRRPGGTAAQQRYGFNVPATMVTGGRLLAPTGWSNIRGLVNAR